MARFPQFSRSEREVDNEVQHVDVVPPAESHHYNKACKRLQKAVAGNNQWVIPPGDVIELGHVYQAKASGELMSKGSLQTHLERETGREHTPNSVAESDKSSAASAQTSLWRWGAELGLWMFGGFAFQAIGFQYTTAQKSGFLVLAAVLLGKTIRPGTWASVAAAVVGTTLLAIGGNFVVESSGAKDAMQLINHWNVGEAWSIVAALTSAMFILRMEQAAKAISTTTNKKDSSSAQLNPTANALKRIEEAKKRTNDGGPKVLYSEKVKAVALKAALRTQYQQAGVTVSGHYKFRRRDEAMIAASGRVKHWFTDQGDLQKFMVENKDYFQDHYVATEVITFSEDMLYWYSGEKGGELTLGATVDTALPEGWTAAAVAGGNVAKTTGVFEMGQWTEKSGEKALLAKFSKVVGTRAEETEWELEEVKPPAISSDDESGEDDEGDDGKEGQDEASSDTNEISDDW